jgi:hypothetical protein
MSSAGDVVCTEGVGRVLMGKPVIIPVGKSMLRRKKERRPCAAELRVVCRCEPQNTIPTLEVAVCFLITRHIKQICGD